MHVGSLQLVAMGGCGHMYSEPQLAGLPKIIRILNAAVDQVCMKTSIPCIGPCMALLYYEIYGMHIYQYKNTMQAGTQADRGIPYNQLHTDLS